MKLGADLKLGDKVFYYGKENMGQMETEPEPILADVVMLVVSKDRGGYGASSKEGELCLYCVTGRTSADQAIGAAESYPETVREALASWSNRMLARKEAIVKCVDAVAGVIRFIDQ